MTSSLLELSLALAASGMIAGLLAGLFGIGGGAVLVPVFYQILGIAGIDEAVRMHIAVGSSTGIILPTAVRSFLAHKARGAVDLEVLRGWIVAVPLGAILAALSAAWLSSAGLRLVFAVIAFCFALWMLFKRPTWRISDDLPPNPWRTLAGVVIGYISTLMGIGGGVLNNAFMALHGRPMLQAVATSSGVGVLIAVPGTIGYMLAGLHVEGLPPFSLGFVNLLGVLIVIPITLWMAPLGVRLAHRLDKRILEMGFGFFLLLVAIKFALTFT